MSSEEEEHDTAETVYTNRKPKWWRQLSKKGTKGQRRLIQAMQSHVLTRPAAYGETLDLATIFPHQNEVALEIGFGQGDNLLALAHDRPDVGWIGAEIHQAGIAKILQKVQRGVRECSYWNGPVRYPYEQEDWNPDENAWTQPCSHEQPYDNLRVYTGDGVKLLAYLRADSLDRVVVPFPDPFPKSRDHHWRILQKGTVQQIHRILKPGGCFCLATDHDGFFQWSLQIMTGLDGWTRVMDLDRTSWLPVVSYYEHKGHLEGRTTHLACWTKRTT